MIHVLIVFAIGYVLSVVLHICSDRYFHTRLTSWDKDELSVVLSANVFWLIMLPYIVMASLTALPEAKQGGLKGAKRKSIEAPVQSLTFISTHEDLIEYIVELDKAKSVCDIDYVYDHGCMPRRYTEGGYINVGSITAGRITAASITFGGIK